MYRVAVLVDGFGFASLLTACGGGTAAPPPAHLASGGAWMAGLDANGRTALVRFDANLMPVAQISGSNTQLDSQLDTDANGDAYVFSSSTGTVSVYAADASGNVAPARQTVVYAPGDGSFRNTRGFALDGAGGAFIHYIPGGPLGIGCAIAHVMLDRLAANATMASDCTEFGFGPYHLNAGHVIARGGHGYLYVSYPGSGNSRIVRYLIGSGGTLTRDAILLVPANFYSDPASFGVDADGNVYSAWRIPINFNQVPQVPVITEYPASSIVSGTTTDGATIAGQTFPGDHPLAIDAAGNLFSATTADNGVAVFPSRSPAASATTTAFRPFAISAVRR